jgi:nicotinate-nucleotide pyrophosphorylase (carboxylating)
MNQEEHLHLISFIKQALMEDVGDGDHTSLATVPTNKQGTAKLIFKDQGVAAAVCIFQVVDPTLSVTQYLQDGDPVSHGDIGLTVTGNIHSILTAERLVLNIMQRMSGIATVTNGIVKLLEGTKTKVLDTRKTTPLLRFLEKKAVKIGGGVNHRFGLYDMILIKDNHVDYAGGIQQAIHAAQEYLKMHSKSLEIEIEVRNKKELDEVLAIGGVHRIMLDNFTPIDVKLAVDKIAGKFVTEASGGITSATARDYALAGVDFISIGGLTHSVKSLDISLKATSL